MKKGIKKAVRKAVKEAIEGLYKDEDLISQIREALANGKITRDNLYESLNSGKISMIEYMRSTEGIEESKGV